MNRNIKILIGVLMLCVVSLNVISQQRNFSITADDYRAVHWTTAEGLESDDNNTMIKDATGFMWIGSFRGGLYRFDGSEFRKYVPGTDKRGALNCDSIFSFREDSLHNIWMGTRKGISRYDISADTFTNFITSVDTLNSNRSVHAFWSTSKNVYGLESDRRIVSYNIHTLEKKILLTFSDEESKGMGVSRNYIILDTTSNCLWMLGDSRNNSDRGSLLQISLNDGRRTRFEWPCYRKEVSHRHNAEAIRFDPKRNSIWINSGEGLLEFSVRDKQFHRVEILSELSNTKNFDRGVGIDVDRNGGIWFSTNVYGIFIYNPQTAGVRQVFSDPFLQKVTGDENLQIYCDRDGIIWTSNWLGKGIYQIVPLQSPIKRYKVNPSIKDSLSNGLISTIIPGPGGKLWIGTSDGINVFDPITEKFEVLRERDLPGIKGPAIIPLYIDTIQQKAWLYAGSRETFPQNGMRMYEMDLHTRECKHIIFRVGPKYIDTSFFEHVLVRPFEGGIIFFCDNLHGVFQIKKGSLVAEQIISLNKYFGFGGILLKENRYLLLKNSDLPNYTFENRNGKWTKIAHHLDSVFWSYILYNSKDQSYWVGMRNELTQYDHSFRKIKTYTEEDGIQGVILTMMMDNEGNLWFVNHLRQIGRLNPATSIVSIVSNTEGYMQQDYVWFAPAGKDALGNIYFGIGSKTGIGNSNWGLDRIYPERYSSTSTSSVYVKTLFINQIEFSHFIGINGSNKMSLNYNQNTIKIETGIIDFFSGNRGKLRFKLESNGKQGDWQYPTDPIIRYENLSPGSYHFLIQASNAYNEFTGPKRMLTFNIGPPFWQTWWFRSLAAAFVIAGIYGIARYRSRNLRRRNAELEEKVLLRTEELKLSLENLKATQRQLIQSEKMASLGELTAGIAHEIQNPLNFINNFSEISNELMDEMKNELSKGDTEEANAIALSIQQNLSKINHHGKRADAIVKSMLQHSRSSGGQKESTDLNALCHEYFHLAYHGWRAKDKSFNATIKTDFDESVGNINVIPQEFGRVILNLINNAFYAVDEKLKGRAKGYTPIVSLSTKKTGKKVEIRVADNGNGIPQNVVDKIFQPFFTTKPTGQGTGLGLSLSYDIVSALGGELKVDNREGEGAEFIISLAV